MRRSLEPIGRLLRGPYFIAGIAVALGYYFVDAMVITFWFEKGATLWNNIVSPSPDDIWMRSSTAAILIVLGAVVQDRMNLQSKKGDTLALGLSDSDARLQLIIDSVPAAISYFDSEVRFRFANERYTTLLNARPEALIGMTLEEAVGEKAYGVAREFVERALAGESVTFENLLPNPVGGKIAVSVTYVPHRGGDGSVDGFFALVHDITSHKETEFALRATAEELDRRVIERTAELEVAMAMQEESRRQLEALADANPSLVSRVGADLRYRYVNKAYADWFGKPAEEIVGQTVRELHGEAQYQHLKPQIEAVLSGEELSFSTMIDSAETGERWIHGRLLPDIDRDGKVDGYFVFTNDITELKHAEMEAVRQKTQSDQYLHVAANMMVALNLEGQITLLNRAGCEILECNEGEALGLDWFDNFIPEDRRDLVRAKFDHLVTGNAESSGATEGHILTAKGTRKLIRWFNSAVQDDAGNVVGTLSSGEDITGSRLAEEKLQESEARFAQVFKEGPLGIGIVGLDHRIMAVNESLCRLLEYPKEELIGLGFTDITHPDDIEEGVALLKNAFAGEKDQFRFTKRYITKSGKTIWANLTSSVVRNSAGEPLYNIGMVEDITERKLAEEEVLRQKSKAEQYLFVAANMMIALNLKGQITLLNRAGCETLECNEEEALGLDWFDNFIPEDRRDLVRAKFDHLVTGNAESSGAAEGHIVTAKGTRKLIRWSAASVRDGEGKIIGILASAEDITERRLVEERLRESEDRYAFAVAGSQDGLWDWNIQTGENYFSPRWKEILGYEDHELDNVSETFLDALHAEDRERVIQAIDAHLEDRVPYDIEYRLRHKDGGYVWVRAKGQAIWDEDDQPLRMAGSVTDISARKKAEEALLNSERELANAQRIARMGSWERNLKTGEARWSDELYAIFGVTKGLYEPNLKNFLEQVHADDIDSIRDQLRQAVENRERVDLNYRIVWPDGEVRHIQSYCEMSLDEKGEPARLTGVTRDVTERHEALEALRASEARLTEILDIAPEAVITVGADMEIQLFNEGAERIFGFDAEEILGQPLEILMPEYFRDSHKQKVEEFDQSGNTYRLMDRRQEIIGLRKDGSEFPAAASVSKLESRGEKIFTVMLLDITERKLTRDALIEAKHESEVANRAKSEFLAAMSHDLRTPLNAILGFADLINHQYFGPVGDKYREYANDIRTSGKHLLSLVNEILDLSALEAGKKSLTREKIDFREVIAECETIVGPRAKAAGIDLTKNLPEGRLLMVTDRRACMKILLNLLSNSIKFTQTGGKISLVVEVSNGETVITIADTGRGIEEETLAEITEPFVQGRFSPYLANEGWGLGLAIVKSLVSLLDGKFEIKSRFGHGTTITVMLPTGQLDQDLDTSVMAN